MLAATVVNRYARLARVVLIDEKVFAVADAYLFAPLDFVEWFHQVGLEAAIDVALKFTALYRATRS